MAVLAPAPADLPAPPPGRSGWPWTDGSDPLPEEAVPGVPWPKVTIVTPSYNQSSFVEETIRSVLLQAYPALEYLVIDGGSTDGSVEVIRRYEPWLTHWESERDRGQAHAINKGFARATGEIVAWLNSDDSYLPGTLARVARAFVESPEAGIVHGDSLVVGMGHTKPSARRSTPVDTLSLLRVDCLIPQPAVFMRRAVLESAGYLDERLHFALDYDLWLRCSMVAPARRVEGAPLAVELRHADAKTVAQGPAFWPDLRLAIGKLHARDDVSAPVRAASRYMLAWAYHTGGFVELVRQRRLLAGLALLARAVVLRPAYLGETIGQVVRAIVRRIGGQR